MASIRTPRHCKDGSAYHSVVYRLGARLGPAEAEPLWAMAIPEKGHSVTTYITGTSDSVADLRPAGGWPWRVCCLCGVAGATTVPRGRIDVGRLAPLGPGHGGGRPGVWRL
jgi:hypothetical protein